MKINEERLKQQLHALQLGFIRDHYPELITQSAHDQWPPIELLARLIDGESQRRADNALLRRIKAARFPTLKTIETFDWNWPKKINRAQIQNFFRLAWVAEKANVILLGNVGLGKTHLAIALGYAACQEGATVLFTPAVEMLNALVAAQAAHRLKTELQRFRKPRLLVIDELGYLPVDKQGADLLFQVFCQRYESGATLLTTNKPFKQWSSIFNNDASLTSALLDRLLHHAELSVIDGKSYRMKDQIEEA